MTQKHTPGPWATYWGSDNQTGKHPCEVAGATGHPIAHVLRVDPAEQGDHESNAQLIAASPDLLAACKEYIAYRQGSSGCIDDIARRMKDAIAKAEKE